MGKVHLKEIVLENFRSFIGPEAICFPESGLISVSANNENTGGSSGGGKTTLLLAISYLLDYCPFSATDLQTWYNDKPLNVTGTFLNGDKTIKLSRSPNLLKIENNKVSSETYKNTINTLVNLPSTDLLAAITYRVQREKGLFLNKTDSEKKEFLSKILGLDKFEDEIAECKKKLHALEIDLAMKNNELAFLRNQFKDEELGNVDTSDMSAELDKLKRSREEFLNEKKLVATEYNALKVRYVEIETKWKELLDNSLKSFEYKAETIPSSELQDLRPIMADIKAKMDLAGKNKCPTCKQPWLTSEYVKWKDAWTKSMLIEATLKAEESSKIMEQNLKRDKALSEFKLKTLEKKETELSDLTTSISKLEFKTYALNDNLHEIDKSIDKIESDLKSARETAKRLEVTNNKIQVAEEARAKIDKLLKAELDYQDLIGRTGFLGLVFDEILVEISEETNKLLRELPNVTHVTLQFESEFQNSKDITKRTIIPVISVNGQRGSWKALTSGGMQVAIELAVDLAVGTVVSRRTNSFPGWLILDEAIDNLDSITKEACLNLLAVYAKDNLVLVVDHTPQIGEAIDKTIEIDYTIDKGSKFHV